MRLVIAECTVDFVGRLTAHLPKARRLLLLKADGSISIHADDRAYKPLNWMNPPCTLVEEPVLDEDGNPTDEQLWVVYAGNNQLRITLFDVISDTTVELGEEPGLIKDGVEKQMQALLAEHFETFGTGWQLIKREYPTAIGPVDLLGRNAQGGTVAIEVKRNGHIDGVEQLTRYLEMLNRDELLAPVHGILAAEKISKQARTLAIDRGIECVVIDYDELRGMESNELRLF